MKKITSILLWLSIYCISIGQISVPPHLYSFATGGMNDEKGMATTTDALGNVFITGSINSSNVDFDPGVSSALLTTNGVEDIYVAKYNMQGQFQWAFSIGGTGLDEGKSITADGDGSVYVTGKFNGTNVDFDPGPNVNNLSSNGATDIFVAKYSAMGQFIWAHNIGSATGDEGRVIETDLNDDVYVYGNFTGSNVDFDPGTGTYNMISKGGDDCFVVKYDNNGNFQWSFAIGGGSNESGNGMCLDNNGNVIITGFFQSTNVDFDPGAGSTTLSSAGGNDIWLAKYNTHGTMQWAYKFGDTGNDGGNAVSTDQFGNIVITGTFQGSNVNFDPFGNNGISSNGASDWFIAMYDSNCTYQWALNIGGSSGDVGKAVRFDDMSNIVCTGTFIGSNVDFDPGANVMNLSAAGVMDIGVVKLYDTGAFQWAFSIGGASADISEGLEIDLHNNIYLTGSFNGNAIEFDPGTASSTLSAVGFGDPFLVKYSQCVTPFQINDTVSICQGENYMFGTQSLTITGNYSEQFMSITGCDSFVSLNLTVTPVDTSISLSGGTLWAQTLAATYQWIDCNLNQVITGATNADYTPIVNGSYACIVTQNGCTDTSACLEVIVTALEPITGRGISLFPNPVQNDLHIETPDPIQEIWIFDLAGQAVESFHFDQPKMDIRLSLDDLIPGIYFVKLGKESTDYHKILKW